MQAKMMKLYYSTITPPEKNHQLNFHTPTNCTSKPKPTFHPLYLPEWADSIKENGMRKPRPLYTPSDWRRHRSSTRHFRHVLSSLSSRVILSLLPPVFSLTAFATAVAVYNSVALADPSHLLPVFKASPLPYQLTAPALALLLVFRTEASYARYLEGRKAWLGVVGGVSELAGAVMAVNGEEERFKMAVLGYVSAFPVSLKCHVIADSDAKSELQNLLQENDLEVVLNSKHRPRCLIEFISQSIQMLRVEETKRIALESKLSCFHEGIGVFEQLQGIPIPLSYTRLTSRFLVFWHLTLPIVLWDDCNWFVVPATFISAACLFCIEEVGVLIEEPFSMLALDELCGQLQSNIQEALNVQSSVKERVLAKRKKNFEPDSGNGCPKP